MNARCFAGRLVVPLFLCGLLVPLLAPTPAQGAQDEPNLIVVQHILIAFKRSVPGKTIPRTKREARELAYALLERARTGEDFDALVKQHTDDSYPGVLKLTNKGAPLLADGRKRSRMVASFGDVGFRLEVGEVGLAKYHGGLSPYGWHIIKRLE